MTDEEPRPVPAQLADFEIIRRLGAGGMAEVFLAKKRGAEGTYKLLVVKRILPQFGSSRRFRSMFAEEAQLATRLNHPNIVQVYDFQDYGEEGQLLSMEYVEGPDLRKVIRAARTNHQKIPPYIAAWVVAEVAKGLHYAHERRDESGSPLEIVHRDVSPQNILLSFEGAVKVADFGIASANLFREEPGVLKGKTAYMSPEQARAEKADRRTDIYSLGVVFHELLTGRPLHGAADGPELLEAVRAGQVEPPSTFARDLPPELEQTVMRALAKNADERYQTARELAGAITRILFQKQQLVDSHVLEGVIGQIVSREHTSPGVDGDMQSAAGSQFGDDDADESSSAQSVGSSSLAVPLPTDEQTGPGHPVRPRRVRDAGREVRHVVIATLRLHGLEELEEAIGTGGASHFLDQLRGTLDEIAFKRGARWTWEARQAPAAGGAATPSTGARAVVGLTANPSRAPFDAAWLACDVHEAIAGASYDMPVEVHASLAIIRGVANGRRDKAGHLVEHSLQESHDYLSSLVSEEATAGATLVAGGIYRLVRRDFVWGDAPTIGIENSEERGLPANMRVYALIRPLTRDEKLHEAAHAPSDLIGRDAELADLQAAYHNAVTPNPSGGFGKVTARVVYGELGIGKTALVATFLSELPPDARVLRVECSPARTEVPFANVAEWVRQLTNTRVDQSMEEVQQAIVDVLGDFASGPTGPEIVTRLAELVVGRVAAASDEGDVVHYKQLIASGIRRFFARSALEAPLVVLIEGLQWSDRPSLELVSELLKRGDPVPLLVVLVTRPDDSIVSYIDGIVRIELDGLSAENQVRLLQARLGANAGVAEVCADLLPRAAGNPFFLIEMVDALLERGTLELKEREDGTQELIRVERAGDGASALPSTLEQLIADRLAELPAEEQEVVEWLAVAGGPLTQPDLDTLKGTSAEDSVIRLCARGLCDTNGDQVDVRHPLTRDVAYRGLEKKTRERMHRVLGLHLRHTPLAEGLTAAIVARHLARGRATTEAAELYLRAASVARSSYQVQLSTRYYRRALGLLDEGDLRRFDGHEALENITRFQGRWRERRKHLVALRRLAKKANRPQWVATALFRTARFEQDEGHLARGLTSARRAEQVANTANMPVLEAQTQALMSEMLRDLGDMQGALAACDRALRTADHPDVPPRFRAEVLRTRGTLLRRVGRVHEAVDAHAEAIAVFRQAGARRQEARAKNSLAFALYVLGRCEDAIALALDAIRIDLAIGGRFQIAKTLSNIGQCYARLGDYQRGLAYLKRAREAHERYGDQDARADTLLCTAEVLVEVGDIAAADTYVGDAGALTAVTGSAYDSVHEKILRALLARVTGDSGSAVMYAFDARQAAEAQAYVAFHFYAMAVEAAARADIGEHHTGILLATTAMGAIETIQGSEFGLETRAHCIEALENAESPQAAEMQARACRYVEQILESVRDPELREAFVRRKMVARLLGKPLTEVSDRVVEAPSLPSEMPVSMNPDSLHPSSRE